MQHDSPRLRFPGLARAKKRNRGRPRRLILRSAACPPPMVTGRRARQSSGGRRPPPPRPPRPPIGTVSEMLFPSMLPVTSPGSSCPSARAVPVMFVPSCCKLSVRTRSFPFGKVMVISHSPVTSAFCIACARLVTSKAAASKARDRLNRFLISVSYGDDDRLLVGACVAGATGGILRASGCVRPRRAWSRLGRALSMLETSVAIRLLARRIRSPPKTLTGPKQTAEEDVG